MGVTRRKRNWQASARVLWQRLFPLPTREQSHPACATSELLPPQRAQLQLNAGLRDANPRGTYRGRPGKAPHWLKTGPQAPGTSLSALPSPGQEGPQLRDPTTPRTQTAETRDPPSRVCKSDTGAGPRDLRPLVLVPHSPPTPTPTPASAPSASRAVQSGRGRGHRRACMVSSAAAALCPPHS